MAQDPRSPTWRPTTPKGEEARLDEYLAAIDKLNETQQQHANSEGFFNGTRLR